MNDGVARTADGRLFHARGAATGKAGRRASMDELAGRREPTNGGDDGRRRQPPDGRRPRGTARPCRSDNVASEHRGGSVSALELATSGGREGAA